RLRHLVEAGGHVRLYLGRRDVVGRVEAYHRRVRPAADRGGFVNGILGDRVEVGRHGAEAILNDEIVVVAAPVVGTVKDRVGDGDGGHLRIQVEQAQELEGG